MVKKNIPVILAVTLLLLLAFACLPMLVSAILDAEKTPSYNDIRSVKLDISQEGQDLGFTDKLILLGNAQTVDIDQDQAVMTEAEVAAAVSKFLQKLENAGIYAPFSPTHTSYQPKLMYDLSDSARYTVVWTVTMTNKKAPNQSLMLDVDDQTGVILCVNYSIYRSFSMDGVWERNRNLADRFSELYFEQLGIIRESDTAETNSNYSIAFEYGDVDGGVSEAIYRLSDSGTERLTVLITVDGAGGFRISLFS